MKIYDVSIGNAKHFELSQYLKSAKNQMIF